MNSFVRIPYWKITFFGEIHQCIVFMVTKTLRNDATTILVFYFEKDASGIRKPINFRDLKIVHLNYKKIAK